MSNKENTEENVENQEVINNEEEANEEVKPEKEEGEMEEVPELSELEQKEAEILEEERQKKKSLLLRLLDKILLKISFLCWTIFKELLTTITKVKTSKL